MIQADYFETYFHFTHEKSLASITFLAIFLPLIISYIQILHVYLYLHKGINREEKQVFFTWSNIKQGHCCRLKRPQNAKLIKQFCINNLVIIQ